MEASGGPFSALPSQLIWLLWVKYRIMPCSAYGCLGWRRNQQSQQPTGELDPGSFLASSGMLHRLG